MKRVWATRIFRREFAALAALMLASFGAMSLAVILRAGRAIEDRELLVSAAYRDEVASRLLAWLQERKADVLLVSGLAEIAVEPGAEGGFDRGIFSGESAARRLAFFAQAEPQFSETLFIGADGRIAATRAGPAMERTLVADRDYFKEAMTGRLYASGFFQGRRTGSASIAISAPLRAAGEIIGVLVGLIPLENVVRIVEEAKLKDYGSIYLLDARGRVVSNAEFARRFKALGDEAAGEPSDSFAARELAAGRAGAARYLSFDGASVIGAYRWIEGLELGLIVETEREDALKPVYRLFSFAAVLAAALMALLLALSAAFSARLIAPIGALIEGAEALIRDNFREPITVRTGTELDQLVELFNRLAETVRERELGLRDTAARDSLTGLFNHGRIEEFLEIELRRKRRSGETLSFVMIDIDDFKTVNDTHGHLAGDEVLRGVSRILEAIVRGGDVAGRYGGEEFAILLDAKSDEEVESFCERIRRRVMETDFGSGGGSISVTVSLGWTRCEAEGKGPYDIVRSADRALYEAKESGKNSVRGRGQRGSA